MVVVRAVVRSPVWVNELGLGVGAAKHIHRAMVGA